MQTIARTPDHVLVEREDASAAFDEEERDPAGAGEASGMPRVMPPSMNERAGCTPWTARAARGRLGSERLAHARERAVTTVEREPKQRIGDLERPLQREFRVVGDARSLVGGLERDPVKEDDRRVVAAKC